MKRMGILFALCFMISCSKQHEAIAIGKVAVVKHPFPLDYGKNEIVCSLNVGATIRVKEARYGKDYVYNKISFENCEGFVFNVDSIKGFVYP